VTEFKGRTVLQADTAIARIRETRHQISERFSHDPQKLVAYYVGLQKKYQDRVVGGAAGLAQAAKSAEQSRPAGFVREGEATYTIQSEGVVATGESVPDKPKVQDQ
jgi:restriction endonuclease Mrr